MYRIQELFFEFSVHVSEIKSRSAIQGQKDRILLMAAVMYLTHQPLVASGDVFILLTVFILSRKLVNWVVTAVRLTQVAENQRTLCAWHTDVKWIACGLFGARGGAVVEALRSKPEGRGIDSRWCQNFSLT
jgi:uncharacterized membrane protein